MNKQVAQSLIILALAIIGCGTVRWWLRLSPSAKQEAATTSARSNGVIYVEKKVYVLAEDFSMPSHTRRFTLIPHCVVWLTNDTSLVVTGALWW